MKNKAQTQTIMITGASSGLGTALSLAYAKKGVTLLLHGRNVKHLNEVVKKCRAKGAKVETLICDTREAGKIKKFIKSHEIDLLFANAGVSGNKLGALNETEEQTRYVFETNLMGTMNTVWPAIDQMRKRRSGQIVLTASIAGYIGLSSAPAYSASKAAVKTWGAALRGWLKHDGIKVNTVCPGFVKTPMTDVNPFPMPFIMTAHKAARIIQRGVSKNKARIAFPWPMVFMVWFANLLPASVSGWLTSVLPKKSTGGLG